MWLEFKFTNLTKSIQIRVIDTDSYLLSFAEKTQALVSFLALKQ